MCAMWQAAFEAMIFKPARVVEAINDSYVSEQIAHTNDSYAVKSSGDKLMP